MSGFSQANVVFASIGYRYQNFQAHVVNAYLSDSIRINLYSIPLAWILL